MKPPEIVSVGDRLGVKLYLCQACAAKCRALKAQHGGQLREIDVRLLCQKCRPTVPR